MKKYGFINNLGELRLIQNSIYKGSGNFVGITRNGLAYIHTGTEAKQLTRDEVASYLNLNAEQVNSVIRSRGKVDFDLSEETDVAVLQPKQKETKIEKPETTRQVRTEIKDTQMGREKTDAKASVEGSVKVEDDVDFSGAVSLDQSSLKTLSLKNQVKYVKNRLKWMEENYISKDQMIEIIQLILQEK